MNNRQRHVAARPCVIATALAVQEDHLLLAQLARGRFAGFWLLPSGTVDGGATVAGTLKTMLPERTGFCMTGYRLISVLEEPKADLLSLRFLFDVTVDPRQHEIDDPDIAQARWFARAAVKELLAERDAVPRFGVMATLRAWVDGAPFQSLETIIDDALCPCGSGFRYAGCCGWDAR